MKNTKTQKNISKTPAVLILAVVMLIGVLYAPGKSLISGLTQPAQAETTEEENYANREMPSTQHGEWVDDEEDEET
ncbi:MAG: hypothetical protein IJK98_11110, partial [Clostridia bacterium]|nr:hypothetical protein [Clostridia bacterium]